MDQIKILELRITSEPESDVIIGKAVKFVVVNDEKFPYSEVDFRVSGKSGLATLILLNRDDVDELYVVRKGGQYEKFK